MKHPVVVVENEITRIESKTILMARISHDPGRSKRIAKEALEITLMTQPKPVKIGVGGVSRAEIDPQPSVMQEKRRRLFFPHGPAPAKGLKSRAYSKHAPTLPALTQWPPSVKVAARSGSIG